MPGRGFEPPRSVTSTATSTRRVCQFRHPGWVRGQYRVESVDVECGPSGTERANRMGLQQTGPSPARGVTDRR